ncbi:hypothetical protein X927_10100 [Petrotoga mexicana DSM 14811]|jgi:hypothetical protein|uniref:Cell wall-active antibiotics response LiaF-like C-terminal domain-containing protein n=3 Tax=Petrotoga TaxID=28236 RepID=A0A2K1P500_9BACT|nr:MULTISPECIES: hypothetical protein [Petrotoga]PNR97873.1 hypothetical protein X927_10100 [Petrotoga mexicana DSM 14811]PNS02543.1 hypothetical protein X928_00205 [Petrotoga miotherma DSM 10691]POZ91211.1 hypothetical protein AA81_10740 [Petrotoga halophila DSM 16923]
MQGRLILIALGILIVLSVIFNEFLVSFNLLEFFFTLIFLGYGLTFFKKRNVGTLGSLIFGIILLLDTFELFPTSLNFWELVLLMIASYIIAAGFKGLFHIRKPHLKINKSIISENLPPKFIGDTLDLSTDVDWSSVTIDSSKIETPVKVKAVIDNDIYSFKKEYDSSKVDILNKLKVSNVKVPERAKITVYLNENINYNYQAKLNVSVAFFDLRQIKTREVRIKSTASKITLIPSQKDNTTVDVDSEVSAINIKLPGDVALVLNHVGDLNFKNFGRMYQREDGTYVSDNFSEASYTCYLNISSEISRLNIEFI